MTQIDKLKLQRSIAVGVLAVGAALLAFMISVEGEPGLLPLLLVSIGGSVIAISNYRLRKLTKT